MTKSFEVFCGGVWLPPVDGEATLELWRRYWPDEIREVEVVEKQTFDPTQDRL